MTRSGLSIIELREVSRAPAPGGFSLGFPAGSFTVLRGEEGSGKEGLFRLLGLFAAPETGELLVEGQGTRAWSEGQRNEFRARRFGYVLAAPFLLPGLTLAENIAMPLFKHSAASAAEAVERAEELLVFTGLAGRAQTRAGELTLEDQYAVAIARALAIAPAYLLVEEIDADLQGEALRRVAGLLREVAEQKAVTVIATASLGWPSELSGRTIDLAGHPTLFAPPEISTS